MYPIAPLKLSTDASHTCSISSSWLTGLPRLRSRYSKIPLSFLVKGTLSSFAYASRFLYRTLCPHCSGKHLSVQIYVLSASDPRLKLLQMKWFFHVIIGSCIQPFHFIRYLASRRQNQHLCLLILLPEFPLEYPFHLCPVNSGQAQ